MVNNADPPLRQVDISLVAIVLFWRSESGLRFLYPNSGRISSTVLSALEPDIASETAVLRRRPPQTLLEHPPKRKTFYIQCRLRELTKCMFALVARVV